jgi:putative membrane protein
MSPEMHSSTTSWSVFIDVTLVFIAFIYLRGWFRANKAPQTEATVRRASAFLSGELLLFAVMASPLARLDHQWLTAHMLQHLVLMTLAAPLILLGEPALMFWNGLLEHVDAVAPDPVPRFAPIYGIARILANPAFCWLAGTVCVLVWHIPGNFDLAMQSSFWHGFQQVSFFVAGLLFWWPVIPPWPSIARWHQWSVPMYLFLATIPCDALSAFLTFCGRIVYPAYGSNTQLFNNIALADQELAGAIMWVWVTFVYLIPAVVITMRILSPVDMPVPRLSRAAWDTPAVRSLNSRAAEEF